MSWADAIKHGHFSPQGDGGLHDPHGDLIDERLMVLLDEAREQAGVPFVCTSGARSLAANAAAEGAMDSAHLIGADGIARAVDGYFLRMPLLHQFLALVRFPFFGLGLYPYPLPGRDPARPWTSVVHVDRKDRGHPYNAQVLWVRNAAGRYVYWPSREFQIEIAAIAAAAEV